MADGAVGAVRHDGSVPNAPEPLQLLPKLPLRKAEDLVRCAGEIHADRCAWLGADAIRPCTCGVPKLLAKLVAQLDAAHGEAPAEAGA